MGLDYRNYRLTTDPQNMDWLKTYSPRYADNYVGPAAADSGGGVMNWLGSIGKGAVGGSALGPLGSLGGALLGAGGAALNAIEEDKRAKQEQANFNTKIALQKEEDKQQQKNTDRQFGMNAIGMMKDDFETSLYRYLTRAA